MPVELIELEGHIIDSLIFAKVLDVILAAGGDYRVVDVDIGKTNTDVSTARLEVSAPDEGALASLLEALQVHGANRVTMVDATLEACTADGVLPSRFYSTTNLPTEIRLGEHRVEVENPETDCALMGGDDGRAHTVPMHR